MKRTLIYLSVMFSLIIVNEAKAQFQCKRFVEKRCKVFWDDYVPNPQNILAELETGQTSELNMIFYRGHDYRVILCGEEHLGDLRFKILSSKGDVLFDNQEYDMTQEWDFTMSTTKRLIIEVTAPGGGGDFVESGCVAVMIGLRPTPKKGF